MALGRKVRDPLAQITPNELLEKQFKQVRKGFEPTEVIATLRDAAETVDDLQEENASLKERLDLAERELTQYQKIQESLNAALITAQKSAEETRAAAKQEAESTIREAQAKAKEILFAVRQAIRKSEDELAMAHRMKEKFMIDLEALLNSNLEWVRSQPRQTQDDISIEGIDDLSETNEGTTE
jgi:cell division initiation protein